jgi:hypothetical protein
MAVSSTPSPDPGDHVEQLLDQALAATFPASDPDSLPEWRLHCIVPPE